MSSFTWMKRIVFTFRLLLSAFACCLIGYLTVRMFYDGTYTLPTDTATTLTPAVVALTIFEFMTGVGGNASITAALNTTARSFPDRSVCQMSEFLVILPQLLMFSFSLCLWLLHSAPQ